MATLYYVHADHLNTPRAITNQAQQLVWRWENQEPFGNNPPEENPSGLGAFEFNLRFPGQYADRETGLNYNYYRDYDPQTGRYVQSDPIGLSGGTNPYTYAKNNPLRHIDPLGLLALCPPSAQMKKCLEGLFGESIDDVQVIIDAPMVERHMIGRTGAVTRPNKIFINMTCDQFWGAPPSFILHEYFHVLRQWAQGMTAFSYLLTFQSKEAEAEAFGQQNGQRLKECLTCSGSN